MKDIHNHLIFGIDDGSESIETSIKILNEMSNRGVTEIVLTPHYIILFNGEELMIIFPCIFILLKYI